MRIAGDPDGCRAAARELLRAAAAAAEQAERVVDRAGLIDWRGTAAGARDRTAAVRAEQVRGLATRLEVPAGVLLRHAAGLDELQERAAALVRRAALVDLVLGADGSLSTVPPGPFAGPAAAAWAQEQQRVRRQLAAAVDDLRHDDLALHARTRTALATALPGGASCPLVRTEPDEGGVPGLRHLPGLVLATGHQLTKAGLIAVGVLKRAPVVNVVSAAIDVAVDVHGGADPVDALVDALVVTGVSLAAGAAAAAAVASAPVWVGVAAVVGVGFVASLGAGWVLDQVRGSAASRARMTAPTPRPGPPPTPRTGQPLPRATVLPPHPVPTPRAAQAPLSPLPRAAAPWLPAPWLPAPWPSEHDGPRAADGTRDRTPGRPVR